jgi:hypothetical protein
VIPAASLTSDQDPDFWGHSKETSRSFSNMFQVPEVLDVDDVVNLLPAKLVQQKHLERKLCNLEEFYSFPYDYLKPVQQLFFWVKHSIQEASADIAVNFQLTQASEDM